MNWYGIALLQKLGLAWDVKLSKLGLAPQVIADSPAADSPVPSIVHEEELVAEVAGGD
jgi:hypothetical protein